MSLLDTTLSSTALVRSILEEEGAAATAFFVDIDRGKLLQYMLIHVQCTKKKAPEYRYLLYPWTGIRFKKVIFETSLQVQPARFIVKILHTKKSWSGQWIWSV